MGFHNSSDDDRIDSSGGQTSFGAGIGWKKPVASRLGARFELGFAHRPENEPDFVSSSRLYLSFGLSYFTP